MPSHGFRVGTIFGFPIVVDVSVLSFWPWVVLLVLASGSGGGLVRSLLQFPIIFGSVLLHELGHALAARALGVPVRHIALTWFGGHAAFWTQPTRWRDAAIAFAGPAANLGLAALLFAMLPLVQTQSGHLAGADIWVRNGAPPLAEHLVRTTALLNLGFGAFNLLPALPLDGGHIMRTGLATLLPLAQAHRLAAWSGVLLGSAIVAYAIWMESWWGLFIGGFIAFAAWNEHQAESR